MPHAQSSPPRVWGGDKGEVWVNERGACEADGEGGDCGAVIDAPRRVCVCVCARACWRWGDDSYMNYSWQGVPETLASGHLLQLRGNAPPFPPFTWSPLPSRDVCPLLPSSRIRPPTHLFSHGFSLSPFSPHRPLYLHPGRADGARRRGPGGRGEDPAGRVTVRASCPEPPGPARVREEPAWARRGRVRGAGVRARVCARPRRSVGRVGGGGGGGVRTPGTPPPAPRPAPAQPPASVRAAPRLRAQRRRLREPSGVHRLRPRRRCGAAPRPPQSRPPREGAEPPPPGWRASPRSPSACSCGCSCLRCPAPGRRAPQVSASPAPSPSPARPGACRRAPGGESCAGSRGMRGAAGRSPGPRLQPRATVSRRARASVPGPRRPSAGRVRRSAPLYFPAEPPASSNFPRLWRIFPLAASHLSESVT